MLDTVLLLVKDYGPFLAAVAIAGSSIYTAWVLRQQNRSTGWLRVEAYKILRVGRAAHLYYGGEILAENDQRQQEIHVCITNVGYRLERIMQVEYYVVSQGWRLGPQPSDTIYLGPDPEEWSATEIAAPHRVFAVPFDIDPQHLRCWERTVGHRIVVRDGETIRDDQRLHRISCVKVKTFKGETIHTRLLDAAGKPSWPHRLWSDLRCRVGAHR